MNVTSTWEPILKSASIAILNKILAISLKLLVIPLLINYLGAERFGIWLTISAASGYIFLLDMGLSSAMVNRLTGFYARGDSDSASKHFFGLLLFMGALAIVGIIGIAACLSYIDCVKLFKIHAAAAKAEINLTIFIAFSVFFMQLPLSLIQKVPYTLQAGYISELHIFAANIISAVLIFFGFYIHAGLPYFVLAISAGSVVAPLTILVHLLLTARLRISFVSDISPIGEFNLLKSAGMHFVIMQICGTIIVATPFTLITIYHGAEAVVAYGILLQILIAIQTPLTVMLQPAWTKIVELDINREVHKIKEIFNYYLVAAILYSVFVCIFFTVAVSPILEILLKHQVIATIQMRIGFAIWCCLGLIGGGGVGALILALGLTRELSRVSLLQVGVFLITAFALVPTQGAVGAVIAIILSYLLTLPITFSLIWKKLYNPNI